MDWSTPRWDYVNPSQDVKADLDEVSGGLCSLSEKMRRRNLVPELVFSELASDLKRLEDDGTLARLAVLRGQGSAPAQPAEADNKTDNNADPATDRMIDMLAGIMAPGPQAQA
jgi:capsid protein